MNERIFISKMQDVITWFGICCFAVYLKTHIMELYLIGCACIGGSLVLSFTVYILMILFPKSWTKYRSV